MEAINKELCCCVGGAKKTLEFYWVSSFRIPRGCSQINDSTTSESSKMMYAVTFTSTNLKF